MTHLDFSPLEKAIASLEDILNQEMDPYRRDGVIQRFEYTFELCWKFMQRVLKEQGITVGSPKQIFRAAHQANLIDNIETWFEFLEIRNLSAHSYNEESAEETFEAAKSFLPLAQKALASLKDEAA